MSQAHTEWNTLFSSRRITVETYSRKPRFIEFITGAASLISGLLDGYEKHVMARHIKFLSQNQYDLFKNQNRLLTYVPDTQDLNNRRFLNMQQHMAHQRNIITEIWAETRQTRQIQNDTETEICVVEATLDYMNYMYTVFLPALESVVNELKLRQAAYQTLLQGYLSSLILPTMLADIVSNANEKLTEMKLKLAVYNLEFLYTMKIATVHRVRRSLYVTLLLHVIHRSLTGYFHLYKVNTYYERHENILEYCHFQINPV